ncbi:MAG: glycoside hydrolase family 172 protein [Kiritimatiellia bacterium]
MISDIFKRFLLVLALFCFAGCSRPAGREILWTDLINELKDADRMARLDTRPTQILTSYDRTGGNNDFNNFARKGPEGWVVLAELDGPGYVSRFWFTGAKDSTHGLRMYFDGERQPRIDTTIGDFCGGTDPFRAPLAAYESYCWYSWVPVPFRKKLTIMAEDEGAKQTGGGAPGQEQRLFYQINYSRLNDGETIQSWPRGLPAEQKIILSELSENWKSIPAAGAAGEKHEAVCKQNSETVVCELAGPAVLRELRIRLDDSAVKSAVTRRKLLRDLVLRISWDGGGPSVNVPLGDFFGSMGQRLKYDSMFFGYRDGVFSSRFPMPFEKSAKIEIQNLGAADVPAAVETIIEKLDSWPQHYGYFHAAWQKSGQEMMGRPHNVLRTDGSGKFAGCLLGATSFDRSWWLLESDETMRMDSAPMPQWRGTGLEDYFNGGWYYQNFLARPLNGIVFKAPYRTVQYRIHFADPVYFTNSFDMNFERGPEMASRGVYESVAYYYLKNPQPAPSQIPADGSRYFPDDPVAQATFMTEIHNLERMGDDAGAAEYIDFFMEKYPDFPFAETLRMRQAAYREKISGAGGAPEFYKQFLNSSNEVARKQAGDLEWFYADESHALFALYCNAPSRAFIDGKLVANAGRDDKCEIARVELKPGRHVIAVQAQWKQYPDWMQFCLRTHRGDVVSEPDSKYMLDAAGTWMNVDYDDSQWPRLFGTGVKGPPEAPYVWVEPHPFIGMNSAAKALRPDWDNRFKSYVVYRCGFDVPSSE